MDNMLMFSLPEADLQKTMRSKTPPRKTVSTCDKEWKQFHRSCYYFTPSKSTWEVARSLCKEKGGDLAIIKSEKEQKFLASHIKNFFYWIGLTDIKEEGKWLWVDGTALDTSVTFWKNGEPNNQGNEDCGILYPDGQWNDMICSDSTIYAICEKALK
uniref:C-type lectin domain-containing protein n=1 Tax=Leptobrachium leishanense TaxID=445787 RepID=A0A8C5N1P8_9ANUR